MDHEAIHIKNLLCLLVEFEVEHLNLQGNAGLNQSCSSKETSQSPPYGLHVLHTWTMVGGGGPGGKSLISCTIIPSSSSSFASITNWVFLALPILLFIMYIQINLTKRGWMRGSIGSALSLSKNVTPSLLHIVVTRPGTKKTFSCYPCRNSST